MLGNSERLKPTYWFWGLDSPVQYIFISCASEFGICLRAGQTGRPRYTEFMFGKVGKSLKKKIDQKAALSKGFQGSKKKK